MLLVHRNKRKMCHSFHRHIFEKMLLFLFTLHHLSFFLSKNQTKSWKKKKKKQKIPRGKFAQEVQNIKRDYPESKRNDEPSCQQASTRIPVLIIKPWRWFLMATKNVAEGRMVKELRRGRGKSSAFPRRWGWKCGGPMFIVSARNKKGRRDRGNHATTKGEQPLCSDISNS